MTDTASLEAEVQRLRRFEGLFTTACTTIRIQRREIDACVADRDAWKRRAERWKAYAQLIRAQAMFDLMCNRARWHRLVKRYRRMQVQGHPWARR